MSEMRFTLVDLFAARPLRGNLLAAVEDADARRITLAHRFHKAMASRQHGGAVGRRVGLRVLAGAQVGGPALNAAISLANGSRPITRRLVVMSDGVVVSGDVRIVGRAPLAPP